MVAEDRAPRCIYDRRTEPAAQRCWSVLGPRSVGNRWLSMGTSGHGRHAKIAGRTAFTTTSDGEAAWDRVQPLSLHHEDGRTRPRQPCPNRALRNGSQRSPTVSNGQLPRPLTCVTACHWAAGQCFPSSRFLNTGSVCWGWRPVQPVSCSRARSIRLVASRTSCRSSSVNSAARYSTIQAILGRSWIIHGVSRSPGAKSECVSCVSSVSRLPQVGHLGAGVVMHGSMVRAEVPVHLVRAGSARHREPLVLAGHDRSRPVRTNRSLERLRGQEHG
jgi:hypothetical protein